MQRWILAATTTVLLAGTSACAQSDSAADPPVLDPGSPGDSPSSASEQRLADAKQNTGYNPADVDYLLTMIEHHSQAVEMTDLAEERGTDPELDRITERIAAAQEAEITMMEEWLETNVYTPVREGSSEQSYCSADRNGEVSCPTDLDHSSMPGMASPEELTELENSDGEEFDRLFVELMSAHHEGGIDMAEEEVANGQSTRVTTMANDVIAEQRADIARMEEALS